MPHALFTKRGMGMKLGLFIMVLVPWHIPVLALKAE